jgi:hypothetical protein
MSTPKNCQHHSAEVWAKAVFVCLRATNGSLFECRQCPQCPASMTQSVGFAAGAQALANRLASLVTVPLGFSLAAQALATQCRLIENQRPEPVTMTVYLPTPASDDELVIPRGTTLQQAERLLLTAALRWQTADVPRRRSSSASRAELSTTNCGKRTCTDLRDHGQRFCREPDLPGHRVFACIEPAIRLAFPTSIESAFA